MQVEQVPAPEWEQWVADNDAVVLDIREPTEWEMGTLPGSLRIRMGDLPGELESLDTSRATLVVCRTGSRSNYAAAFLAMAGFDRPANLAGGLVALGMEA